MLVLITSAAAAVTISIWSRPLRWPFLLITLIFVYTTLQNVRQRPEGIKISSFFIITIVVTSLISRAMRSTELRITGITLDEQAESFLAEAPHQAAIRIVARNPHADCSEKSLAAIERNVRHLHGIPASDPVFFFQVERGDSSNFEDTLSVHGTTAGKHRILRAESPVIPNAFAALLIELEKRSGTVPHAYFTWTEGPPLTNILLFLFFGEGDVAPLTHEVLRRAIADPAHRPMIHVG